MEEKILTIMEKYYKKNELYNDCGIRRCTDEEYEAYKQSLREVLEELELQGSEKQIKWAKDLILETLLDIKFKSERVKSHLSSIQHVELKKKNETAEDTLRYKEQRERNYNKKKEIAISALKEAFEEKRSWRIIDNYGLKFWE